MLQYSRLYARTLRSRVLAGPTVGHSCRRYLNSASFATHALALKRQVPEESDGEHLPLTSADDRKVSVGWDNHSWSKFHHIWLRDHCRCPDCFHPVTKQRLLKTFEIPADIKPSHVEAKADGLEVIWSTPNHHVSFYSWSWLENNTYDPPVATHTSVKPLSELSEKFLWGSKIAKAPPTVRYEEVMKGEEGLYKWLANIDRFGICFVSGVPVNVNDTEALIRRIAFIRETQYGTFWDFTSDLAKGDTAYTTLALGAHTDTTYLTDPCGLQLFHLLSHTDGSGGASLLVDGFYVASIMKKLYPEAYNILSTVRVPTHAAGEEREFYRPSPPSGFPVLNHDPGTGKLVQIRYNNDDRSVINDLQPSEVEPWYEAMRIWHKLLTSTDSEYWVQLTPGTVIAMDNHRVLHGRSSLNGKRRMCGAYVGIDDYRSKLTVLREKFMARPACVSAPSKGRSVWAPGL